MQEDFDWDARFPHVRHRFCPGCREELSRFHLIAVQIPIEQLAMPLLLSANEAINWSIRPFGNQNLHELQLLVFSSACTNCTLISTWDFGTEELQEITRSSQHPPYAQIAWNYAPELIRIHAAKAPDWLKPQLEALLKAITPGTADAKPD